MKKIVLLLAAVVPWALTACAQKKESSMEKNETKTLVAYFSATGTTQRVAQQLADATGADLFEIAPEKPYTAADLDWTNKQSRSTVEMQDTTSRPAIKTKASDISRYDTVFIGFPIWWYTAPTIINTFLEQNDLQGKTLALFATSGGSTPQKALEQLRRQYPNLKFVDARLFNHASKGDLRAWAEGLNK